MRDRAGNILDIRRAWRNQLAQETLVQTLEADPAWPFKDALRRGGAGKHYRLTDMPGILDYPLPPLASDCRLFLWRVGAMQHEALAVMKAWGFKLKAEIIWIKTTQDGVLIIDEEGDVVKPERFRRRELPIIIRPDLTPSQVTNLHYGMGQQVRYAHEVCLIGTRGSPERLSHHRSVFFAPVGEHSEKPQRFYDIVRSMSPGPHYSLFSRKRREGWWVDGDQLPDLHPKLVAGIIRDRQRLFIG